MDPVRRHSGHRIGRFNEPPGDSLSNPQASYAIYVHSGCKLGVATAPITDEQLRARESRNFDPSVREIAPVATATANLHAETRARKVLFFFFKSRRLSSLAISKNAA